MVPIRSDACQNLMWVSRKRVRVRLELTTSRLIARCANQLRHLTHSVEKYKKPISFVKAPYHLLSLDELHHHLFVLQIPGPFLYQ